MEKVSGIGKIYYVDSVQTKMLDKGEILHSRCDRL